MACAAWWPASRRCSCSTAILQEPGLDTLTTVKIGAPLTLGVLGIYAFGAASSLRDEEAPETPA